MAAALLPFIYEERLTGDLYGGAFSRRGRNKPQLALGEFLLRRRRLAHWLPERGDAAQQAQWKEISERQETIQREWRVHYQRKLREELAWRGRRLQAFLREQREEGGGLGGFAAEARRRTLAQELWREQGARGHEEDAREARRRLAEIDAELRPLTSAAPFAWDATLAPVYPAEEFWWLYATSRDRIAQKR
ncbi:MAG: hypothetical protein OXG02_03395 [Chloroflexi bacterium]|nr:hypothetical protein [Chloroflexota bacterium]